MGTETHYYDHNGQRMLAVRRDGAGAILDARYFFAGTEIQYSGSGFVSKSRATVSLGQAVARIERTSSGEELSYLYHSPLQHLLVALDDSGSLDVGFVYGPFGEILEQFGGTGDYDRRFNDKYYDNMSSLSYYGFRYYDPLSLTWTQADPKFRFAPDAAWDDPRQANLYVFSMQNPMRYLDPDGLDAQVVFEWHIVVYKGARADNSTLDGAVGTIKREFEAATGMSLRVMQYSGTADALRNRTDNQVFTFIVPNENSESVTREIVDAALPEGAPEVYRASVAGKLNTQIESEDGGTIKNTPVGAVSESRTTNGSKPPNTTGALAHEGPIGHPMGLPDVIGDNYLNKAGTGRELTKDQKPQLRKEARERLRKARLQQLRKNMSRGAAAPGIFSNAGMGGDPEYNGSRSRQSF